MRHAREHLAMYVCSSTSRHASCCNVGRELKCVIFSCAHGCVLRHALCRCNATHLRMLIGTSIRGEEGEGEGRGGEGMGGHRRAWEGSGGQGRVEEGRVGKGREGSSGQGSAKTQNWQSRTVWKPADLKCNRPPVLGYKLYETRQIQLPK